MLRLKLPPHSPTQAGQALGGHLQEERRKGKNHKANTQNWKNEVRIMNFQQCIHIPTLDCFYLQLKKGYSIKRKANKWTHKDFFFSLLLLWKSSMKACRDTETWFANSEIDAAWD